MTYRERRQARAERLRDWADKRQREASAVFEAGEQYHGDTAFNTQPGHFPLRARVIAREDRALDSLRTAQRMQERADNIEAAADASIYDDDPDAIERLRQRIEALERVRASITAFNKTARKGSSDLSLLSPGWQRNWQNSKNHGFLRAGDAFPAYVTANLGGRITKDRQRLERLERRASD